MPYDDTYDFDFNDETSVEFNGRQQKAGEALKKVDKYYDSYSIPFNKVGPDGKFRKRLTIESYGSGQQGTLIRNAVTGFKYNSTVGSADEDLFFKVADARGRDGRKEPLMLYYDSPEQYENHHYVTVDTDVKMDWYRRSLDARRRLNL